MLLIPEPHEIIRISSNWLDLSNRYFNAKYHLVLMDMYLTAFALQKNLILLNLI